MEQTKFQWIENKQDEPMDNSVIIDSLVNQSTQSLPTDGSQTTDSKDILNYLLQTNSDIFLPDYVPPANNIIPQGNIQQNNAEQSNAIPLTTSNEQETSGQSMFSVAQSKGNFLTFVPATPTKVKSKALPKKARFKEPIFVTESPYKSRKKKSSHSSGDDVSEDDIDDDYHNSDPSLKMMTSKEKRQLRNKISARNFRVRRKEYITELEEKVQGYEATIKQLQEQNEKLQKVNQELMVQLMTQPATPPSTMEETSSSSEGYSPQSVSEQSPANMFQFQLDDLYDFSLFNAPSIPVPEEPMSVYLNHATIPDWDLPRLFDEKQDASSTVSNESMTELMEHYPLLGPALMSIVLRHTLSLEYVNSFADELKATFTQENEDEAKQTRRKLITEGNESIEGSDEKNESTEKPELLTRAEIEQSILRFHFSYYAARRAGGFSHDFIVDKCSDCMKAKTKIYREKLRKDSEKQKEKEKKKSCQKKASLYAYCQVAGKLLKGQQRFTQINKLFEETRRNNSAASSKKIRSSDSLISSFKNIQISNNS